MEIYWRVTAAEKIIQIVFRASERMDEAALKLYVGYVARSEKLIAIYEMYFKTHEN